MQSLPRIQQVGARQISANQLRESGNWQRQQRLIAGEGIVLSRTLNGIVIKATAKNSVVTAQQQSKLLPFSIRWMSHHTGDSEDKGTNGEWQIYVPVGSAIHNGNVAKSFLDQATDAQGKHINDWYAFIPKFDGLITAPYYYLEQVEGSEDPIEKACATYAVYLLKAPMPIFKITDSESEFKVAWEAECIGMIGEYVNQDGVRVHVVSQTEGQLGIKRWGVADNKTFSIVWKTDKTVDEAKEDDYYPVVTNQRLQLGRLDKSIADDTRIGNSWHGVALRIKHSTDTYEIEIINLDDVNKDNPATDTITEIVLYEWDESHQSIIDNRGALKTIPFYN